MRELIYSFHLWIDFPSQINKSLHDFKNVCIKTNLEWLTGLKKNKIKRSEYYYFKFNTYRRLRRSTWTFLTPFIMSISPEYWKHVYW